MNSMEGLVLVAPVQYPFSEDLARMAYIAGVREFSIRYTFEVDSELDGLLRISNGRS